MRRKINKSMTAVMLSAVMLLSGILIVPIFEPTQLNAQIFEDSINDDAVLPMNDDSTNQIYPKEYYEESHYNIDPDSITLSEWEEELNPLSPLNLTELNRTISDAQTIEAQGQGLIPRPQWVTFRNAIAQALFVRDNISSTQVQVNAATSALREAINSITIFTPPFLNLAALNAVITEAQAREAQGQGSAPRAEWATFRNALASAIAVRNNINATQAQVNTAANVLREAIDGLSYVFITLDPGVGGVVNPQRIRILRGDDVGTLPTPTRSSAGIFIGWSTAANGGVLVATDQTATQDATFHARWTDPNRHLNYWTRPTPPITHIYIQNVNMLGLEYAGWRNAMQSSMNSWNNSDTPIQVAFDDFATVTTVTRTVDERDFRLGTFLPVPDNVVGPNLHGFRLTLNTFQIGRHARLAAGPGADDIVVEHIFYRLVTHVFAHEIGHTVGLEDDPQSGGQLSIMTNFLNPHDPILAGPQPFDVDSVNLIYR